MLYENEKVIIKVSTSNKKRLEDLGYSPLVIGQEIEIFAKDLSPRSKIKVICQCDYCGCSYETPYASYYNSINNSVI